MYEDATAKEIDEAMQRAWQASIVYRKFSLRQRAAFMHEVGEALRQRAADLVDTAMGETHLPAPRLQNELTRTIFQLNSYAEACRRGDWLEARIDTAIPDRTPPKPDIRKMLEPLGPVVVFGASNFPFAYSTAGGDTACAWAAGCPVIVKAHPAHAQTSEKVAAAISSAAAQSGLAPGIFSHLHGQSFEVSRMLVMHPYTAAVGFTGSFSGGKQLYDWAAQRKQPIPVFAEMGSINPVFLLPEKLKKSPAEIARLYASSITMSVGQFCTNPGLIVGIHGEPLDLFVAELSREIKKIPPGTMLHPGIAKAYAEKRRNALQQEGVETLATADITAAENQGMPTIASASAEAFFRNPVLHQEVFGPYSIIIRCQDIQQMTEIANRMDGQLTGTVMGTDDDILQHEQLIDAVRNFCGRVILNGVPTGVEVCLSMQHGGPFPATTDSRFTSVGADGIKRFARPVAYQNWNDPLLPEALKNSNPLGILRTVNDQPTREPVR